MLLFLELVFALVVSVFLSLLFSNAKLLCKATSLSVPVADVEENKKHPQFNDEVDYADHVFDESPVGPRCGDAEEGGGNVVSVEEVRVFGVAVEGDGVFNVLGFEGGGFVECPVRLKGGEIAVDLEGEDKGDAEVIEVGVIEKGSSKKSGHGGLEFEGHNVNEFQYRGKNPKFVPELEKKNDNVEVLQEIKVINSGLLEKNASSVIEFGENLGDESPESAKYSGLVIRSEKKEDDVDHEKGVRVLESEESKQREYEDDVDEGWLDDWEGIERTELEKKFGEAVVFVGSKSNAHRISSFDNEVKMRLCGLHKVAIEGACHVQRPMAFKVSARAKWNAWHLLGDMSREVAMEEYIALLSKSLLKWKAGDCKVSSDIGSSTDIAPNLVKQPGIENTSISERLDPCDTQCELIGVELSNSILRAEG